MFDIQAKFLDKEREDKFREKAKTRKEKAMRWARIHPKISLVTGTLLVIGLIYSILPLGFLYFLPAFIVKQIIYLLIGGIVGFYVGRSLFRRYGIPKTEIVKTINMAQSPRSKRWRHLRGSFLDEFEFKHGEPVKSTREDGIPVYTVVEIDWEERIAYCSPWGDMDQAKMFETMEAIRSQFLYNDDLRKFGAEINMKMEQIVSQVEHNVANAFIRKLESVAHPEDLMEASETGIPTRNMNIETPDLEEIVEQKTNLQNPEGLEPENRPEKDV